MNAHLQQIAQRESGGDIHATNPSSGASGKFQFLQSTWDSVAPAEYQGQPAANAPEAVQDAAAQNYMMKLALHNGLQHNITKYNKVFLEKLRQLNCLSFFVILS